MEPILFLEKCVEGLEVIDKIAAVKVDGNNRPEKDVRMKITLVK